MNRLCSRPPSAFLATLPVELGGYSYACDLRDSIAREVCFTGRYEPQDTALLRRLLKPGMNFIDVGANWGYFTLVAAYLVGAGGRVLSLEPDPRLYKILGENVERNGLRHVSAHRVAASDRDGTLTLAGFDESGGNFGLSRVVEEAPDGASRFSVASRSLDALLDEREGFGQVDVLKMDIEGAEDLALSGMRVGLARGRYRCVLLELHPTLLAERGRSVSEVVDLLVSAGYRGWRIDHTPAATRRAAYSTKPRVGEFLRELRCDEPLESWPHVLWLSPEAEALGW
jgi:FkbM family methyltransferase